MPKTDINSLYSIYAANCARFPALYNELSKQLGVSTVSLCAIGVGFCPVDEYGNQAWVFAERDAKGNVVGVQKRLDSGKKYAVPGSKRGLVYAVNFNTEQHEKKQWVRVSIDHPCPLCAKPDGCMYPDGEYNDPNAVICVHIASGAAKPMKLGYLHILDPARQELRIKGYSLLMPSKHPVLVVEGASDVCAAYDLGFTAVGKPSAASKSKDLVELLSGRKCVIFGENDAGAGKAGMESTFAQLQNACPNCTMAMPPAGVKDLRQWVDKGLTQQELLEYIEKAGMQTLGSDTFGNDVARTIARDWLKYKWTMDGQLVLRKFTGQYAQYNGRCYETTDDDIVRGSIHDYVEDKRFSHEDGTLKLYKATRAKVSDILDSCTSFFPIKQPVPSWIGGDAGRPNPTRLITFTNGMFDVDEYIATNKVVMHKHDPRLFSFTEIPYDFDENLESKLCEDFISETFNRDEKQVSMLAQWLGYNLVPDRMFEKLMILLGVIRSGKGTIIDMLTNMLGNQNCASGLTFQTLAGDFGRQPLLGKLSASVPDARNTNSGDMNRALEYILMITGGDAVSVNRKSIQELPSIYLPCRFTIAMNDLPAFVDHSLALESRTLILKFNYSHAGKEDFTLKTRLAKEAADGKLVNFALRGLRSLYKAQEFVVPDEMTTALGHLREQVSPISYFMDRCVTPDPTGPGVTADLLYDLLKWWYEREGKKIINKSTFIRNLCAMMPGVIQIMEGEVGNSDRMLMGIKITEWAIAAWKQGV